MILRQRQSLTESEARLLATLAQLHDGLAAAPSGLPGWSRGLLVAHLARNADSNARLIESVLRGVPRPQYPGGDAERDAVLVATAARNAVEVVADARESAARLAAVLDRVAPSQWNLVVPAHVGPRPVWDRLQTRWFEVEVHHIDLALGYRADDWPADFVEMGLDRVIGHLPSRFTGGPPGTWSLLAEGLGGWDVRIGNGGGVTVQAAAGGDCTGGVAGSPSLILAWLLGRGSVDIDIPGCVVSGDAAVVGLPAWFPQP